MFYMLGVYEYLKKKEKKAIFKYYYYYFVVVFRWVIL